MELQKIPKTILIVLISMVLIFAGCSTNNSTQVLEDSASVEQNSRGSPVEQGETSNEETLENNEEEFEVARRESEELDETQEQISQALTTLNATGTYTRPGGTNTIEVEITLDENDIITAARITNVENLNAISQEWVELYNQGIEAEVVGKPLNEAVSPAVVNRSSLTAPGFNEALEKIRAQRQS